MCKNNAKSPPQKYEHVFTNRKSDLIILFNLSV